ncbi:hypothetical protein [Actinosynnema sp. NPDC020468]|uniref:hypothetical protein n=1 Tax=Actinosynnema sp. NPDC020468 TaxID=3154488 RepID=UPI0033E9D6D0
MRAIPAVIRIAAESVMTDKRVNPFAVPWFDSPMQPLRPFDHESHEDFYVDVDGSFAEYARFHREMGDFDSMLRRGRVALVTGDTGCGKSALVNRCAGWVKQELGRRGHRVEVVDVTQAADPDDPIGIPERMSVVCDQLFDQVRDLGVLRPEVVDEFRGHRDLPHRVYPNLGGYLRADHALVVLLPEVALAREVVAYARYARGRVLFFLESTALGPDDVREVVRATESFTGLVDLRLGELREGDVHRFVRKRFAGHEGGFPRLLEETLDWASGWVRSVAQLQRSMHSTYGYLMDQRTGYGDDDVVTKEDITAEVGRQAGGTGKT